MPYTAEHKRETRRRIVEHARGLFNLKGYSSVTVNEIMEAAGLTHGGFYRHFSSKDELFVEAVETYGDSTPLDALNAPGFDPMTQGADLAKELIDAYVSSEHLENTESQCPMISLASDVSRARPEVRQAYQSILENMVAVFESAATGNAKPMARERALSLAALCIGGMVLARTVSDPKLASELQNATHDAAVDLVQRGPSPT